MQVNATRRLEVLLHNQWLEDVQSDLVVIPVTSSTRHLFFTWGSFQSAAPKDAIRNFLGKPYVPGSF